MQPPRNGDDWLGVTAEELSVGPAADFVTRAHCGALVVFAGTARDHAPGRPGVHTLEYEAYEEQVVPRLASVAAEARARWAGIGAIALVHRTGVVPIGEAAVVVAVSAPHRDEAFAAARFCIDAVKATAPIWKRESWDGGTDWGTDAAPMRDASEVSQ
jgi:molybdopterin synthase catalytic subunit